MSNRFDPLDKGDWLANQLLDGEMFPTRDDFNGFLFALFRNDQGYLQVVDAVPPYEVSSPPLLPRAFRYPDQWPNLWMELRHRVLAFRNVRLNPYLLTPAEIDDGIASTTNTVCLDLESLPDLQHPLSPAVCVQTRLRAWQGFWRLSEPIPVLEIARFALLLRAATGLVGTPCRDILPPKMPNLACRGFTTVFEYGRLDREHRMIGDQLEVVKKRRDPMTLK